MKIQPSLFFTFVLICIITACNKSADSYSVQSNDQSNAGQKLPDSLVAWYTFDNSTKDQTSNHNDVVFNNAVPVAGKSGVPKTAYRFDGMSMYMAIPNSPSLQFKKITGMTIMAKFKITGFYTGPCHVNCILQKGNDQGDGKFALRFDDGYYYKSDQCSKPVSPTHENVYGFWGDYKADVSEHDTSYLKKGTWYTIVWTTGPRTKGVANPIQADIYENGVYRGYNYNSAQFTNNSDSLYIGRMNDATYPYWFNGVIDEIRIYNKPLNHDAALALSNQ